MKDAQRVSNALKARGPKFIFALSNYDCNSIKEAINELSNVKWERSRLHNLAKLAYSPIISSMKFSKSIFNGEIK